MNTKKITSFTCHQTAEGIRVSFTYSIIDSNGNLLRSNERLTTILTPNQNDEIEAYNAFINYLTPKIPD